MSKEEKNKIKDANAEIADKYGFCMMDGHKQKVGNFRIEPPGLFRGRGDHPKQGKLKKRVQARDIIINIGKYVLQKGGGSHLEEFWQLLFNPLSANPTKWLNTKRIRRLLPTNFLSMFNHFVGFALKWVRLKNSPKKINSRIY